MFYNTTMILDGKVAADHLFQDLAKGLSTLPKIPKLAAIQIGENPASTTYIKLKQRKLEELGCGFEHVKFDGDVDEKEVESKILKLNTDPEITGIILQLPIPIKFNQRKLLELINPLKDVDCLTSHNIGLFFTGESHLIPATPLGILRLLDYYNISVAGKNICIVGRSNIVGKPMSIALTNLNATVTLCHSKTEDLYEKTQSADIVIAAMGCAKSLGPEYFHPAQTLIDVGINRDENGKICGDIDFDNVVDLVENISPVPGGVGKMTIYGLVENLVRLTAKQL
jgi:methylenetetrahydrofolate dehydrogenase (NADP+)/methenyltetrahydrofolate cyclohydrolase